jgi:hypothetical protein
MTRSIRSSLLLAACAFAAVGCGGSSGDDDAVTRSTAPMGDAGPGVDEETGDDANDDDSVSNEDDDSASNEDDDSASSEDDPSSDSTDDDVTPADGAALGDGPLELPPMDVESLEPPAALLPDTPPETPISELPPEDFAELCDPYLEEAGTTLSSLDNLCGLAGVNAANEAGAATEEEYQRACGEARIQCETDSAAAQVLTESLECTMPEDCTATVEEVNACYQQLHVLNAALLEPLGLTEFPACEDLTPTEGGVIAAQVFLYFIANATLAGAATDTPIDQADDPCTDLETTCPGLAAPAGVVPIP